METKKFNELTREFLEEFIPKLPKEDKKQLREYIENHPRDSSSSMFAMIKSYIYNNYFRVNPNQENHIRGGTFADIIDELLRDDDGDDQPEN